MSEYAYISISHEQPDDQHKCDKENPKNEGHFCTALNVRRIDHIVRCGNASVDDIQDCHNNFAICYVKNGEYEKWGRLWHNHILVILRECQYTNFHNKVSKKMIFDKICFIQINKKIQIINIFLGKHN